MENNSNRETASGDLILVVEDSQTQAEQLRHLLESKGYRAFVAGNGATAIECMTLEKPILVISDIIMPEMDGYELCKAIKTDEGLRDIPVILLTSLTNREDVIKALTHGADGFITKPFSEEYLISRIEHMLINWRMRKEGLLNNEIEVFFDGAKHLVTSDRVQVMDLLLSTFENAVQKSQEINALNRELLSTQRTLEKVNVELERRVVDLKSSENRFITLVATIPDIVYRIDTKGFFTFVNIAVSRLGYEPAELIGRHFSEIIAPADAANVSRELVLPNYHGRTTGIGGSPKLFDERRTDDRQTRGLEIKILTKGGARTERTYMESLGEDMVAVEVNSSGIYETNPREKISIHVGSVGVIRDITERKRMEEALRKNRDELEIKVAERTAELEKANQRLTDEMNERSRTAEELALALEKLRQSQAQLIQVEKINSLGALAAGVAHELNNPLMGILNFVQYCRKRTDDADRRAGVLEDAEGETRRCIAIVNDLLAYSRSGIEKEKPLQKTNVAEIFQKVSKLLGYRTTKDMVTISLRADETIPPAMLKPGALEHVVTNILTNAIDAVICRNTGEGRIDATITLDNRSVVLRIHDNGCGIPRANIGKIFDPFFTTKPQGKGTGLGLSISQGIVADHGGTLSCESAEGKGTTMTVALPLSPSDAKPMKRDAQTGDSAGK